MPSSVATLVLGRKRTKGKRVSSLSLSLDLQAQQPTFVACSNFPALAACPPSSSPLHRLVRRRQPRGLPVRRRARSSSGPPFIYALFVAVRPPPFSLSLYLSLSFSLYCEPLLRRKLIIFLLSFCCAPPPFPHCGSSSPSHRRALSEWQTDTRVPRLIE